MTYELAFLPSALREWEKLDNSIRQQFKRKLAERLDNPRVPASALHHLPNCYKIKLRQSGFRLVYQVNDNVVTVTVIAVGKREDSMVYHTATRRLNG